MYLCISRSVFVSERQKTQILTHLIELFLAYLLKISKDNKDFKCALIRTQFFLCSYFHTAFFPVSRHDVFH